MFKTIREDIQSVLDRDPAARNALEVLLYPGLYAIWAHRLSHRLWKSGFKLIARALSNLMRSLTGIEIHPGASIGSKFFIDHGMGVVIGETAEVGDCVTLYHGVTLGGTSLQKVKRHPTIEDHVVIGAGAKVLGAGTIGSYSRVGANAVVVKSTPPNSVVVGVPGQIVMRDGTTTHAPDEKADLEHGSLPDTIGETLAVLIAHVNALEERIGGHTREPALPAPDHGVWHWDDFSI